MLVPETFIHGAYYMLDIRAIAVSSCKYTLMLALYTVHANVYWCEEFTWPSRDLI